MIPQNIGLFCRTFIVDTLSQVEYTIKPFEVFMKLLKQSPENVDKLSRTWVKETVLCSDHFSA